MSNLAPGVSSADPYFYPPDDPEPDAELACPECGETTFDVEERYDALRCRECGYTRPA